MLDFDVVPHWGWRAHEGQRIFEIERLEPAGNERFQAYERKKGAREPVAKKKFRSTVSARRWLEQRARS